MGKRYNEFLDAKSGISIVREYSKKQKENMYKDVASAICKKYNDIISENEIFNILNSKSTVYFSKFNRKNLKNTKGIFMNKTKNIHFNTMYFDKINSAIVHECIHKMQDYRLPKNKKGLNLLTGFIEGATESIASKIANNNNFRCYENGMTFNLPINTAYVPQVSIVEQMDYILGNNNDLAKFALCGDMGFLNKICKLYGKDFFIKMRENLNDSFIMNDMEQINEYQNFILDECYNKKFEKINIKNEEELIDYLNNLKEFEKVRGIYNKDNYFEKFYNDKYNKIREIFIKEKFDLKRLENLTYSDEYRRNLISNNSETKKDEVYLNAFFAVNIVVNQETEEDFDYKNYEIHTINYNNKKLNILFDKKNNIPISAVKFWNGNNEKRKCKRIDIKNQKESEFLIDDILIKECKAFSTISDEELEIIKENIYIPNMENEVEMFKMTNLDYIEVLQNTCKDKRYAFQNKMANMFSKIYEKTLDMIEKAILKIEKLEDKNRKSFGEKNKLEVENFETNKKQDKKEKQTELSENIYEI